MNIDTKQNGNKVSFELSTDLNNNKSYIKYLLAGNYTIEDIEKIPCDIIEQCKTNDIWNVLLDTNNVNQFNIGDYQQIEYGEIIANVFEGKVRLAVYGDNEIFNRTTETIATNRGAQIRVSNNHDSLMDWLKRN